MFFPFYSIIRKLLSNMTTTHIYCLVPKCCVLLWPYFPADAQHSSCYLSAWQWNRIVKRFEESSQSILLGFKWRDFTNWIFLNIFETAVDSLAGLHPPPPSLSLSLSLFHVLWTHKAVALNLHLHASRQGISKGNIAHIIYVHRK